MHSLVVVFVASCRSCSWLPGRLRSDRSWSSCSRIFPASTHIIVVYIRCICNYCHTTSSKTSNCQISTITCLFNVNWTVASARIEQNIYYYTKFLVEFNDCLRACRAISASSCIRDVWSHCTIFCYSLEWSYNIIHLSTNNMHGQRK